MDGFVDKYHVGVSGFVDYHSKVKGVSRFPRVVDVEGLAGGVGAKRIPW